MTAYKLVNKSCFINVSARLDPIEGYRGEEGPPPKLLSSRGFRGFRGSRPPLNNDTKLSGKFSDEKQKCIVGESILRPSRNVENSHEILRPAIKDNNQLNSDQKITV